MSKIADPKNECGIAPFNTNPDPASPDYDPFTPACNSHDQSYVWGGSQDRMVQADKKLLEDSLAIAEARGSLTLKLRAYAYYFLASTFGRYFWKPYDRSNSDS